jgi:hypothetical protein
MNDDKLAELAAIQTIAAALNDYCRAMDRIDDELGRSVFHADAVADYGDMYQGSGHGFIDFVHDRHAAMLAQQHQLGNVSIRVQGDRAGSESYVTATLRFKAEDGSLHDIIGIGRYVDRWERRDGRWAISHRRYLHTFDDIRAVTQSRFDPQGARDRSDPSYAVLAGG